MDITVTNPTGTEYNIHDIIIPANTFDPLTIAVPDTIANDFLRIAGELFALEAEGPVEPPEPPPEKSKSADDAGTDASSDDGKDPDAKSAKTKATKAKKEDK
ncbi:hypothetical protein [Photobacterium damselae]|uniref:hypothetical protein n=1 Tax=Photobacterium damselae TaxID=38293 RepID=UPI001F30DB5F|nr:hypothetical protein [Photobacterium damselae]UKA12879.1 hypothetical protein IHC91_21035 [Photobacterium damselae subsp. damselae]